ncbi:lipoprotein [gut metagenome]|uniref:Lipoprotein n=1 Tax=gut metagenome TaxID=749906 RepID=J9H0H2_9ZZZZ
MKLFGYIFLAATLLSSCAASQYNIDGNSTVSMLDGRTLYLRVAQSSTQLLNVDSSQVVHGRFTFSGNVDSVVVAHLYMEDQSMMPVVLENGKLAIEVNNIGQKVTGGPLNKKLYDFIDQKMRMENEQWELDQLCMRMMRQGSTIDAIHTEVGPKAKALATELEQLETNFIIENFDNALGPACFMLLFGQYPVPIMTQQIETIVEKAPQHFLNHPIVKEYLKTARDNATKETEYTLPE